MFGLCTWIEKARRVLLNSPSLMPQSAPAPRRSQRDRKQVKQFASSTFTPLPLPLSPQSEQPASPRTSAREPRNPMRRTHSPNFQIKTTPSTSTTTRTQNTTTNKSSPRPNQRNALPRRANQGVPLHPRNRALPSLLSQSRSAPKQNLQMDISMPPSSLQIPRLTRITRSSVRPLHTLPGPYHLNLHHRHHTKPLGRASINRGGLSSLALPKCRSSTGRIDQLHLACMWLQ